VSDRPDSQIDASRLSIERLRLFAIGLGLALLVFRQRSGQVAADTKLDLLVDPLRFLRNSVSIWDGTANAGQLQDQAYGYLFPMGPFFVVGKWAQLDPWVIQRSWEALLVLAAFVGAFRLARALGLQAFWPAVGAGLSYALAPRVLSELFVISSELLPLAALPFVMLPLVRGIDSGSVRKAASRSGVALLFAGGINASATVAILSVPVLWLLCQPRGKRRASLTRWWCLAVLCATIWWVVPLLVLGKYSPPFLDWIESSAVTTSPTSLLNVLRGVDHWQSYLGASEWPGAWILASSAAGVIATAVIAAMGLMGLVRAPVRHRLFLLLALIVGVCLVTAGHVSTLSPAFTPYVRSMLDGPLNAFRNVHKFDPVVRLPISLGFGFALSRVGEAKPWKLVGRLGNVVLPRWLPVLSVLCLGLVAVAPAMTDQLVPRSRLTTDPVWWHQTADWLQRQPPSGRALVLPGAAQPAYFWGNPRDDALQPFARSPWSVRDATPLAQAGYIRLLDQVEYRFAAGRNDSTLSALLARSGVQFVVARNDLTTTGTRAAAVHSTLERSPGFVRVQIFGPSVGGSDDPDRLVDAGLSRARPAVEIFTVEHPVSRAELVGTDAAVSSNGSSDNLPSLLDRGLGPNNPVLLNGDGGGIQEPSFLIATDGLRRRESAFSNIATQSETMTAGQPYRSQRAAHDYLPSPSPAFSTVSYSGIADVQASSSASSPSAYLNAGAGTGPFAAIDGESTTSWRSSSLSGASGQWLQVDFLRQTKIGSVSLSFAQRMTAYPTRIRATTDASQQDVDVVPDSLPQPIRIDATTRHLRITVLAVTTDRPGQTTGIADLAIPGVAPSRWLNVALNGTPSVLAFDQTVGGRAECLAAASTIVCDPEIAISSEESSGIRRQFELRETKVYAAAATIRLISGPSLSALLDSRALGTVTASSTESTTTEGRPGAVLDGSDKTSWIAAAGDRSPSIDMKLKKPSRLTSIVVRSSLNGPYASPRRVLVRVGDVSWTGNLPDGGVVRLAHPVSTDRVSVTILEATVRTNTDSRSGATSLLPVGVSEISLPGITDGASTASKAVDLSCSDGLHIRVDGKDMPLRARASIDALIDGSPILAVPCGNDELTLRGGTHRVELPSSFRTEAVSVTLSSRTTSPLGGPKEMGTSQILGWSDIKRTLHVVAPDASLLIVHENANAGWRASLGGADLTAVRVDGWQQAWIIPPGSDGVVTLSFRPQRAVIAGLMIGCALVVTLLLMALWPAAVPRSPVRSEVHAGGDLNPLLLVACGIAIFMTAGLVGLSVLALASALALVRVRLAPRLFQVGSAGCLIVASLWVVLSERPVTTSVGGAIPQLLCVAAISCLALSEPSRIPRDHRLSRGRSSK
jgi:arabinofuranan 3-O-arabinosyltransferase